MTFYMQFCAKKGEECRHTHEGNHQGYESYNPRWCDRDMGTLGY